MRHLYTIDLIEKLKEYAINNDIPSMDAGVKEALEEYIIKLDKKSFVRKCWKPPMIRSLCKT